MYGGVGVGRLVRSDYAQAIEWLGKAAAQGETNALFHLGQCVEQGRGIPRDESAALPARFGWRRVTWMDGASRKTIDLRCLGFAKAAEKGWIPSLLDLGSLFLSGRGVQEDVVMAHVCYEVAGGRKSDDPREPSDLYFVWDRLSGEQKVEAESLIAGVGSGNPLPMQSVTGSTPGGLPVDD